MSLFRKFSISSRVLVNIFLGVGIILGVFIGTKSFRVILGDTVIYAATDEENIERCEQPSAQHDIDFEVTGHGDRKDRNVVFSYADAKGQNICFGRERSSIARPKCQPGCELNSTLYTFHLRRVTKIRPAEKKSGGGKPMWVGRAFGYCNLQMECIFDDFRN